MVWAKKNNVYLVDFMLGGPMLADNRAGMLR